MDSEPSANTTYRDEERLASKGMGARLDKKPTMLQESMMAQDKLLAEQSMLLGELYEKLIPVMLPEEMAENARADGGEKMAPFSDMTNRVMEFNDRTSRNNRKIRSIINKLEV